MYFDAKLSTIAGATSDAVHNPAYDQTTSSTKRDGTHVYDSKKPLIISPCVHFECILLFPELVLLNTYHLLILY